MSELKIFSSEPTKVFYEIAKREKLVSLENFATVKMLLLPFEMATQKKNDCIKQMANFLLSVYPSLKFSEKQLENLSEQPLSFKMRLLPGCPLEASEQLIVRSSIFLNTLTFNYSASLATIDFLVQRNNELVEKLEQFEKQKSLPVSGDTLKESVVEKTMQKIEETKIEEKEVEESDSSESDEFEKDLEEEDPFDKMEEE